VVKHIRNDPVADKTNGITIIWFSCQFCLISNDKSLCLCCSAVTVPCRLWVNGTAVNECSFLTCLINWCHVWLIAGTRTVHLCGMIPVEFVVVSIIIIIFAITFMLYIYSNIPATNHVSRVYMVAAALHLQFVLYTFTLIHPKVHVQCPIWPFFL
jgi:hypothetical protein